MSHSHTHLPPGMPALRVTPMPGISNSGLAP